MTKFTESSFHHDWLKTCLDLAIEDHDKEKYIQVLENALKELKKGDPLTHIRMVAEVEFEEKDGMQIAKNIKFLHCALTSSPGDK